MADIENNFNSNDFSLISPDGNTADEANFGNLRDYLRLTIRDRDNNIVTLGNQNQAIFYSALTSAYNIDTTEDGVLDTPTPFIIQTTGNVSGSGNRDFKIQAENIDFQIYQNATTSEIYIKPNDTS